MTLRIIPFEVKSIRELNLPPVLEKIAPTSAGSSSSPGSTGSGKYDDPGLDDRPHQCHDRRGTSSRSRTPSSSSTATRRARSSQREVGWDVTIVRPRPAERPPRGPRHHPGRGDAGPGDDRDGSHGRRNGASGVQHPPHDRRHGVDQPDRVVFQPAPAAPDPDAACPASSRRSSPCGSSREPTASGRVPAVEVMIATPYVQECIRDRDKTSAIRDAIASGVSEYGMQTFDQSVYHLFQRGPDHLRAGPPLLDQPG